MTEAAQTAPPPTTRHSIRPAAFLPAFAAGALFTAWRGDPKALSRVFLDLGLDGYATPWAAVVAVSVAMVVACLVLRGVPPFAGRAGAASVAWLLSVFAAAQGVSDPATAAAVGGSLGVLAGFAAFFVFAVEGEGGLVWAGVFGAGILGIVGFAGALGAVVDWARASGRDGLVTVLEGGLGLGALGLAGAVPAALVFFAQGRLARFDADFLSVFAGVTAGPLVVSVAWAMA